MNIKNLFTRKQKNVTDSIIYAHDDTVIELPRTEWRRTDNAVRERKMRVFTPSKEQQL